MNKAAEALELNKTTLEDLKGLKVMTIDDDANALEVLNRILTNRKADVRMASSAAEALDMLRTFTPDIILSDIGMPGEDGYAFIRKLREHPSLAGVPAVALTALARTEDRTAALNVGFQTHLVKPVAAAELVAVVRSFAKLHGSKKA